jgi:hypothetical protein
MRWIVSIGGIFSAMVLAFVVFARSSQLTDAQAPIRSPSPAARALNQPVSTTVQPGATAQLTQPADGAMIAVTNRSGQAATVLLYGRSFEGVIVGIVPPSGFKVKLVQGSATMVPCPPTGRTSGTEVCATPVAGTQLAFNLVPAPTPPPTRAPCSPATCPRAATAVSYGVPTRQTATISARQTQRFARASTHARGATISVPVTNLSGQSIVGTDDGQVLTLTAPAGQRIQAETVYEGLYPGIVPCTTEQSTPNISLCTVQEQRATTATVRVSTTGASR